ncbi:hypothetical protein GCM10022243_58190 [Saccharothrix violaceirubra]|uniref:ABC-2 type transport system permease protein n=1 Tax=Saccharothrix violaceirubra TaxID=413306 RepID=A0A7W7WVW3_9PSEU|nr:ABC transporter permease [Saccharothrix violaceirubra]MBB4965750.1 ABC-2 type transport system permease protein [Saccharothrix violaceirubra]
MNTLRVLRLSAITGFADYASVYTVRSWLAGWLFRVLCQVAFFTLVSRLVGPAVHREYLLVGNAVLIAALESCMVVASTTWERRAGTLPLLVASGARPAVVFCGRSVHWVLSGTLTSSVSLFAVGLVFEPDLIRIRSLAVLPLVLLVSITTYCFGLVLAAVVLRFMELRNVVGNLAYLGLMAICGVQVPVDYWPTVVRVVANVLPLTHGLAAVRLVLAGGEAGAVLLQAGTEALVGAAWLAVALGVFGRLVDGGRRNGSIEFDE